MPEERRRGGRARSSLGPESRFTVAHPRRQRVIALVVMLFSVVALVALGLVLWQLVTSRLLGWGSDPALDAAGAAPTLAVLPFHVAGGAGERLGDDLAEDLIKRISGLGHFPVVSRDESFEYRTGTVDAKRVGRALSVRYVVEGNVHRTGEQVDLDVRVFDARTARPVWAERYEVELANLVALQDRVARLIASAILREGQAR